MSCPQGVIVIYTMVGQTVTSRFNKALNGHIQKYLIPQVVERTLNSFFSQGLDEVLTENKNFTFLVRCNRDELGMNYFHP